MTASLANTDFMDFNFRLQADPTRVRIQVPQTGMSLDLANAVALLMPGPHLIEIGMTLDEIKRGACPEMWAKYGARTVIWKWFDEHEFSIPVVSRALGWYTLKALDQCPRLKTLKYITKLIDTFSFDIQFWAWELAPVDTQAAFAKCLHRDLPVRVRCVVINGHEV